MIGLEPTLPRGNRNLNPARLPISPHPQDYDTFEFTTSLVRRAVTVPVAVLDYLANLKLCPVSRGTLELVSTHAPPRGAGATVARVCAHGGAFLSDIRGGKGKLESFHDVQLRRALLLALLGVLLQALAGVGHIVIVDDVVPVEDVPRQVAAATRPPFCRPAA